MIALLASRLEKKLNPQTISRAFERLRPVSPMEIAKIEKPVAAAVQFTARYYDHADEYIRDIDGYLAECAERRAALACFPELTGLLPLTMLPLCRLALRFAAKRRPARPEDVTIKKGGPKKTPLLLTAMRRFSILYESHLDIFSRFARRYGVYLSAGTVFVEEDGAVYNRHLLFAPDGELLGGGDKIHLVLEEIQMGMTAGQSLNVIATPIGRIALTVCMDATYFETFRAAKALGADYALVPIGNIEPYNPWLALRGAESRAAETGLTAVKSALVADTPDTLRLPKRLRMPLELTGRAGICFPPESGLKSVEYTPQQPCRAVTAEIDLAALRGFQSSYFCLENAAFNARYLEALIDEKHNKGERYEK